METINSTQTWRYNQDIRENVGITGMVVAIAVAIGIIALAACLPPGVSSLGRLGIAFGGLATPLVVGLAGKLLLDRIFIEPSKQALKIN